jgi:hypothetical protein
VRDTFRHCSCAAVQRDRHVRLGDPGRRRDHAVAGVRPRGAEPPDRGRRGAPWRVSSDRAPPTTRRWAEAS